MSSEAEADLCCCEYYDTDGERNHLLACCCNCYHLDESFERFITCQSVPQSLKQSVMSSIKDRIRMPWFGGAKPILFGMPFLYVPGLTLLAVHNLTCTIIAGTIMTIIVCIASKSAMMIPKFFVSWMIVSFIMIIGAFELVLVPWLLILPHENIEAIALIGIMLIGIVKIHSEVKKMREGISNETNSYYCQFCQIYRHGGTTHKYWIDSCVTSNTFKYYLIATLCGSTSLLYVANLILTSVCHPFRVFDGYTFLLPDDCSEVYEGFITALPFVLGIYSVVIGTLLLLEFVVNFLGYTQCFGCNKLLRSLFNCCCAIVCCFKGSRLNSKATSII